MKPTNEFRWLRIEAGASTGWIHPSAIGYADRLYIVLQQKWISDAGHIEWSDLPMVDEKTG